MEIGPLQLFAIGFTDPKLDGSILNALADASDAGLRFPQKTTFFTPKPRAGLVARVFDTP